MFDRGWFRHWKRGERLFERGDLKFVILDLLRQKPRHGYEVIKALEDRFWGFHSPSPGAVYPTLQMLEDMGYVTSAEEDGRKVYSVTAEGEAFLKERGGKVEDIWERVAGWWGPGAGAELHAIGRELHEFGQMWRRYGHERMTDPERLRRIREVIARARREIEAILTEPQGRTD
jgi:DNA-binding PadR family transcriptional regulator